MKTTMSKMKIALLATVGILAVPAAVLAANTTVNSTAKFLGAITLTPTAMAFGNITYGAAPGAPDTVILKTDSTLTYAGTFANGGGTKTAGNVNVTGSAGNAVSIYCDAATTLGNGAGVTIALDQIKVATAADVATGGVACAGMGVAAYGAFSLTAGPDPLKIGARINGGAVTGTWAAGTYSTASGAGDINVTVLYN
jgi:hypothetical protein